MKWLTLMLAALIVCTTSYAQEYRFNIPSQEVVVQVEPPPPIVLKVAPYRYSVTQDNGNGPTPPQPQPPVEPPVQPPINPPDPDRDILEIKDKFQQAFYVNSHFHVKRGILGLGVLPCVSFKPRRVTDPAVQRYYQMQEYLRRAQVRAWVNSQYATIQPVPEYQPAISAYGGYR